MFTSIDLKNGFFHVDIDPNNTKSTAFIINCGQLEFLKDPFELSISYAFNRYLPCDFCLLLADGTIILYMNDFITTTKTKKEDLWNLNSYCILNRTGSSNNFKKCQFLIRKVELLGHMIKNNTISSIYHHPQKSRR